MHRRPFFTLGSLPHREAATHDQPPTVHLPPDHPVCPADDDELVVVVDERDVAVGVAPKLEAHREGRLHRAISVVLFDDAGRFLLQRRAAAKYHSAGRWSNACCGHPRPGEAAADAAQRRLRDELGIEGCALVHASTLHYRAQLDDGLIEHELDHVFVGRWSGEVSPDPREVSDTRWLEPEALRADLAARPEHYTAWLAAVVDRSCRSG